MLVHLWVFPHLCQDIFFSPLKIIKYLYGVGKSCLVLCVYLNSAIVPCDCLLFLSKHFRSVRYIVVALSILRIYLKTFFVVLDSLCMILLGSIGKPYLVDHPNISRESICPNRKLLDPFIHVGLIFAKHEVSIHVVRIQF